MNLRENLVRHYQRMNAIVVLHIEGKRNIADLFTKEMKDTPHFEAMANTITSPRLIINL